jgi:hypothetical protein
MDLLRRGRGPALDHVVDDPAPSFAGGVLPGDNFQAVTADAHLFD